MGFVVDEDGTEVFSEYFGVLLSVSCYQCSQLSHSSIIYATFS